MNWKDIRDCLETGRTRVSKKFNFFYIFKLFKYTDFKNNFLKIKKIILIYL